MVENEFGVSGPLNRSNPEYVPPPLSAVGAPAWNQIDFVRGFGLDVPLESEKEGGVTATCVASRRGSLLFLIPKSLNQSQKRNWRETEKETEP